MIMMDHVLWLLALLLLSTTVQGVPYMILLNTRPKCVSVIAAKGQVLSIDYDVPDIKLDDEAEDQANANAREKMKQLQRAEGGSDSEDGGAGGGMDERWNRRMKDKLENMKTKKFRDMTISITPKGGNNSRLAGKRIDSFLDYKDFKGGSGRAEEPSRVREDLVDLKGSIEYRVGSGDGQIDICVQSISATKATPSRVGLVVKLKVGYDADNETEPALEHGSVKKEMTRLERDLGTLSNRVQTLLSSAEHNKQYEISFYEKSLEMNKASTYWPIIQLCTLVVTGIAQANHIVRYMKSRHII